MALPGHGINVNKSGILRSIFSGLKSGRHPSFSTSAPKVCMGLVTGTNSCRTHGKPLSFIHEESGLGVTMNNGMFKGENSKVTIRKLMPLRALGKFITPV